LDHAAILPALSEIPTNIFQKSNFLIAKVRKLDFTTDMKTPAAQPSPATLPDIPLNELPESTKDFLIALSAQGKSVAEVVIETLDAAATRHGFEPHKAA
jgi:hypothetical protein